MNGTSIQDISLISLQKPVSPVSSVSQVEQDFSSLFDDMISQVNQQQLAADQAVEQLHAGGAKNLHDVMIAMEQADISLRMLVQVRNKAMDAYQEIMRMQV